MSPSCLLAVSPRQAKSMFTPCVLKHMLCSADFLYSVPMVAALGRQSLFFMFCMFVLCFFYPPRREAYVVLCAGYIPWKNLRAVSRPTCIHVPYCIIVYLSLLADMCFYYFASGGFHPHLSREMYVWMLCCLVVLLSVTQSFRCNRPWWNYVWVVCCACMHAGTAHRVYIQSLSQQSGQ